MTENIVETGARHVDEVRSINRELTEKALHMRCLSYLSQIKSNLLTETIFEIDESKKVLLKVNKDIIHQREVIEDQRKKLLEKNKELEAFSYSVSHDLRAPLRHIDGYSQILLEDHSAQLDAEGKDYLKRIRNAAQFMAELIDDLLFLSHISYKELEKQKVNLSELAMAITERLRVENPDRKVEVSITPDLVAKGDKHLLHIALYNLFSNAWKFSRNRSPAVIEFGVEKSDNTTLYYVRDNGVGFDMNYVERMFKAFERLHNNDEYEGTGIGLATVHRIISHHGGRIWAKGQEDKGAIFYFTLE